MQALEHTPQSLIALTGKHWAQGTVSARVGAAMLECAADLALRDGLSGLAEQLDSAAQSASNGRMHAALYTAEAALVQAGNAVDGWVSKQEIPARPAQQVPVSTAVADLDMTIAVRLQYVEGREFTRHDERLTMTVGQALEVLSTPAVGVRAMRLKDALERCPAVRELTELAERYRPQCMEAHDRLFRLGMLSPGKHDGGWGREARKMASRLRAALAVGAKRNPAELQRLAGDAERLLCSSRSALAKRAAVLAAGMMALGATTAPGIKTRKAARDIVSRWYSDKLKANRSKLALPELGSLGVSPGPVEYVTPGPFEYAPDLPVVHSKEPDSDSHVKLWALVQAKRAYPGNKCHKAFTRRCVMFLELAFGPHPVLDAPFAPRMLVPEEPDHAAHIRAYLVWRHAQHQQQSPA